MVGKVRIRPLASGDEPFAEAVVLGLRIFGTSEYAKDCRASRHPGGVFEHASIGVGESGARCDEDDDAGKAAVSCPLGVAPQAWALPARYAVCFKSGKKLRGRANRESRGPAEVAMIPGFAGNCAASAPFAAAWECPSMTGTTRLESVRVRGFRSLADVELSGLGATSVLIGSNGSGKSNFIRFFEMLSWMLRSSRLGEFVERHGGADDQLYGGNGTTPRMEAELALSTEKGRNEYRFSLAHVHPDRFMFADEAFRFSRKEWPTEAPWNHLGSGHREAAIVDAAQSPQSTGVNPDTARVIVHLLRNCAVHQFHDTSDTSNFKKRWDVEDNNRLRTHGGNLAAVLHRLEHEDNQRFESICRHITRVLPVFDRFQIDESYGRVMLRWKAKGTDKTFGAHLTSDGSLRFFALVTLLNLPREMLPDVLLLDEPELGLHPMAVALIGNMIKALAADLQIIVATQSPLLVDVFDLDEILVLDLHNGSTTFRRLDPDAYRDWLDDSFTPGELWQKNLLGGRP